MRPAPLLYAAAAVGAVQAAAHAWLFLSSRPRHGPAEEAVIDAMKSKRFDFLGATRSYWDFYFGYGLMAAFTCVVEAVLIGLLAGLAAGGTAPIRPLIAVVLSAKLGHAALAGKYFFITPVIPDVVISGILATALLVAPA